MNMRLDKPLREYGSGELPKHIRTAPEYDELFWKVFEKVEQMRDCGIDWDNDTEDELEEKYDMNCVNCENTLTDEEKTVLYNTPMTVELWEKFEAFYAAETIEEIQQYIDRYGDDWLR